MGGFPDQSVLQLDSSELGRPLSLFDSHISGVLEDNVKSSYDTDPLSPLNIPMLLLLGRQKDI